MTSRERFIFFLVVSLFGAALIALLSAPLVKG